MNESKLTRVEQLRAFLTGTAAVEFRPPSGDEERYEHLVSVLRRFHYAGLRRAAQALPSARPRFARTFIAEELALLAETDRVHGTLSEPATKALRYLDGTTW